MPTANADLALVLEEALVAYVKTFQVEGSSLLDRYILEGHRDEAIPADAGTKGYVVITATNMGGPLAAAGNYELDVQIKAVVSLDDGGMDSLSPMMRTLVAIFAPANTENAENTPIVLEALNAVDGLGVSCFEFDHGARTKEGRSSETRRHGNTIPYKFHAHLR